MDKAVIIGVYDFLGFHFCRKLLDLGMEVAGIHIDHYGTGFFLEEKRMEIGRNANFKEYLLKEFSWPFGTNEDAVIIFDYYDLFISRREKEFICTPSLKKFVDEERTSRIMAICLFPVQFLCKSGFDNEKRHADRFLRLFKNKNHAIKKFYLPTIYGPWQPEELTFQHFFLTGGNTSSEAPANNREWRWDAIYVDETVRSIWDVCFRKHDYDEFVLTGGRENQWIQCARFLSLPVREIFGNPPILKEAFKIHIERPTPVETALKQQKMHVERLKSQI